MGQDATEGVEAAFAADRIEGAKALIQEQRGERGRAGQGEVSA